MLLVPDNVIFHRKHQVAQGTVHCVVIKVFLMKDQKVKVWELIHLHTYAFEFCVQTLFTQILLLKDHILCTLVQFIMDIQMYEQIH